MQFQVNELFRALAGSQLLLYLALLLRDHRAERSARVTAAFIVGVIAYLCVPVMFIRDAPPWLFHPFFVVSSTVPFTFWMLAKAHFEDRPNVPAAAWLLLCALVLSNYLLLAGHDHGPLASVRLPWAPLPAWHLIPRLLGGGLVLHAFFLVYSGAKTDLVEFRLKLRYVFLLVMGLYILAVLVGETLFQRSPLAIAVDTVNAALIYALVTTFSFFFLTSGTGFLRQMQPKQQTVDPELSRRFNRLMDEENVYKKEGLTIRALAEKLGDGEHKLRHLINSELGFKNFNAFLHHFRIRDAQAILSNPAEDNRTIADIAFELGYQSLGPFNKAFREATGSTPSDFRKSRRD